MRLYRQLKAIYDAKQPSKTDRAVPGERNCRVDSPTNSVYRVKLHGNTIIIAYPDYFEVHNAGWATPTTHQRLWSIAGVSVSNNSRILVDEKYRIYDRSRGISLPFSAGVARIHYDTRRIFDEDVLPDYKTRVVKAVQHQYTKIHTTVWRKIATRVELGEFPQYHTVEWPRIEGRLDALMRMAETEFPTHEDILQFVAENTWTAHNNPLDKEAWDRAVAACRGTYYDQNDGYYKERIDHV